ncbi:GFA family protein [Paracoccus aerodenitrificans]|uniref:GFA family protein n=1 Tax=Paracoccus aerodenitrificans TaxID=3017781 RepID=UPI0022F04174|nr:GFA family protein [Paracoccus aerodenitrificans]WBU63880.1 GFA family protein [Paracoccus aerodenitrificans]
MSSEIREITGGCLCGSVRFRTETCEAPVSCHCGQCRRWSGHIWAFISTINLRITGRENVRWYRSLDFAQRGFCGICGSSLFWRRDRADEIAVSAGTVDEPTEMTLSRHIFTAHKGDYYEIADKLPQEP